MPPAGKFAIGQHRAWLSRITGLNNEFGLHQKGSLQSYMDDALRILSKIETAMQRPKADVVGQRELPGLDDELPL